MTFKLSSKLVRRSFFFKRLFDILFSTIALIILLTPLAIIYIAILCTSYFPIIYWSDRVGKNNVVFKMPKFRSMTKLTPLLPKEKLKRPDKWLTPLGALLRKTSLDELPQLWCVLKGEMSLVGPRPALYNQFDLINLRNKYGVNKIKPGITGWAQINGRDKLSLKDKVLYDAYYRNNYSFFLDLKIIFLTIIKVITFDGFKQ